MHRSSPRRARCEWAAGVLQPLRPSWRSDWVPSGGLITPLLEDQVGRMWMHRSSPRRARCEWAAGVLQPLRPSWRSDWVPSGGLITPLLEPGEDLVGEREHVLGADFFAALSERAEQLRSGFHSSHTPDLTIARRC